MPDNLPSIILFSLFAGIAILALVRIIIRRCSPSKTVPAVVAAKQISKSFSKYSGSGKHEKYVVVFFASSKKRSFYVSKFSYDGYRIGEKGKLTYKGDKLISFK